MWTEAELAYLETIAHPINWDDMGASERDLWEERVIRAGHRFGKVA